MTRVKYLEKGKEKEITTTGPIILCENIDMIHVIGKDYIDLENVISITKDNIYDLTMYEIRDLLGKENIDVTRLYKKGEK